MYVSGAYNGPTDVVACDSYRVVWTIDGSKLLESGRAEFELARGSRIRQHWSSIIRPTKDSDRIRRNFDRFPPEGESIHASISRFEIDGQAMGYAWEGTVERQSQRD